MTGGAEQAGLPVMMAGDPALDDIQLVFVDLQPPLIAQSRTTDPATIAAAAGALAAVASILGWPTTFCIVPAGGVPGTLIPELLDHAADRTIATRTVTDPFLVPEIVDAVAAHGRSTVVLAGFSAEVAVLQSAFGALRRGYRVYVPVDATGSRSARTEAAAFREIERAGAVLTSVRSLLLRLTPDLSCPPGSAVLAALGAL